MSQAEEMLDGLTQEELAVYTTAGNDAEAHIVIKDDRTVDVPAELRKIAVQYDHNIETVTFDCPRYWDGHDLSQMKIYINYRLPSGRLGYYIADEILVDDSDTNTIHFGWTISENATSETGTLAFLVCAKQTNTDGVEVRHWNSELNTQLSISPGLECFDPGTFEHPDIITQLLVDVDTVVTKMDNIEHRIDEAAENAVANRFHEANAIIYKAKNAEELVESLDATVTEMAPRISTLEESLESSDITFQGYVGAAYSWANEAKKSEGLAKGAAEASEEYALEARDILNNFAEHLGEQTGGNVPVYLEGGYLPVAAPDRDSGDYDGCAVNGGTLDDILVEHMGSAIQYTEDSLHNQRLAYFDEAGVLALYKENDGQPHLDEETGEVRGAYGVVQLPIPTDYVNSEDFDDFRGTVYSIQEGNNTDISNLRGMIEENSADISELREYVTDNQDDIADLQSAVADLKEGGSLPVPEHPDDISDTLTYAYGVTTNANGESEIITMPIDEMYNSGKTDTPRLVAYHEVGTTDGCVQVNSPVEVTYTGNPDTIDEEWMNLLDELEIRNSSWAVNGYTLGEVLKVAEYKSGSNAYAAANEMLQIYGLSDTELVPTMQQEISDIQDAIDGVVSQEYLNECFEDQNRDLKNYADMCVSDLTLAVRNGYVGIGTMGDTESYPNGMPVEPFMSTMFGTPYESGRDYVFGISENEDGGETLLNVVIGDPDNESETEGPRLPVYETFEDSSASLRVTTPMYEADSGLNLPFGDYAVNGSALETALGELATSMHEYTDEAVGELSNYTNGLVNGLSEAHNTDISNLQGDINENGQKISELQDAVSDIETALDAILAIQEGLIGTIAFRFSDGTGTRTYTALKGMTWAEWIGSKYNVDNPVRLYTDGVGLVRLENGVGDGIIDEDGIYQSPLTVILDDVTYSGD